LLDEKSEKSIKISLFSIYHALLKERENLKNGISIAYILKNNMKLLFSKSLRILKP